MRKSLQTMLTIAVVVTAIGAFAVSPATAKVGPPGGTIYAHGEAYRTVGTPTDLPDHGRFDTLYVFDGYASVSDAAPGDMDYNGGRWQIRMVTFTGGQPMQYTSAEDVDAAAANGDVEIGEVSGRLECPMIRR